jgi:phosphoglycerate dehydrogenase-like enzyme
MLGRDVVFTNSAGVHAPPMAETVLAMILHYGRGLDHAIAAQGRGAWDKEPFYGEGAQLRELGDTLVGLVGFGGIGREIARRVASLGSRVIAVKRSPPEGDEGRLTPVRGGGRLTDRIELLHGEAGLDAVLREADVVVLCAPETDETRGMMDAAALARMKDGAVLVNVGRGKLIDEDALVAELRTGRLRGAALDVFAHEPLAGDHAFWTLPNVLITPHVSAVTSSFWKRETALIVRNLERWFTGRRLENVVDKQAGY